MEMSAFWDILERVFSHWFMQVIGVIVATMLVHKVIGMVIVRAVRQAMHAERFANKQDREKRQKTLVAVFRTASNIVLWFTATLLILVVLDVDIAALMTGAGLIGIVIGFGAQTTVRDILAGVFIITEGQYRVGDVISVHVDGNLVAGEVEDFALRTTKIRDLDGNLHIIRNGSTSEVTNLSFRFANVNIDVGVGYDADIDKVEKVVNDVGDAMAQENDWKKHIFEPIHFLRVDDFTDSAVRIKALGKVEPAKQWEIAGEFRRRLKKAFDQHNIAIPLPQIVVHQAQKG